jgi:hypothetical protein
MTFTANISDTIVAISTISPGPISIEEVKDWLEWAGQKLLALNMKSPYPVGTHVSWPEFAQDHRTAYGYTQERLRPASPSGLEITLMDEILTLPDLIENQLWRRVVHARLLVTPLSQKYLYSWAKIAVLIHSDRKTVARYYNHGLREIAELLPPKKIHAIRKSYSELTIPP